MARRLLVDANLAVLFAVGSTNRQYIQLHKRLTQYDSQDFDLLARYLTTAKDVVFTPNVLSETSNLIRYVREPKRSEISRTLQAIISRTTEIYVRSEVACARPEYVRLGITDAVLMELATPDLTLLTADFDLYFTAARARLNVVNFNHLREKARADFQ